MSLPSVLQLPATDRISVCSDRVSWGLPFRIDSSIVLAPLRPRIAFAGTLYATYTVYVGGIHAAVLFGMDKKLSNIDGPAHPVCLATWIEDSQM